MLCHNYWSRDDGSITLRYQCFEKLRKVTRQRLWIRVDPPSHANIGRPARLPLNVGDFPCGRPTCQTKKREKKKKGGWGHFPSHWSIPSQLISPCGSIHHAGWHFDQDRFCRPHLNRLLFILSTQSLKLKSSLLIIHILFLSSLQFSISGPINFFVYIPHL